MIFITVAQVPILIDEVQYAPELFTYIKIHVDKAHEPGAFWLTGLQVFILMRGVPQYIVTIWLKKPQIDHAKYL